MKDFQLFDDFTSLSERYDETEAETIIDSERTRWQESGKFSPFFILQGLNKEGKLGDDILDAGLIYEKTEFELMGGCLEKILGK